MAIDVNIVTAGVSTEATLAAVLAKLNAAPSTEAKQDAANALLTILSNKDYATQTTCAAILAKLISAPSTEAKQDAANTLLTTLSGKDFATQTTLAAILAKLITAPATEAKQDTANTSLAAIAGYYTIVDTVVMNAVAANANATSTPLLIGALRAVHVVVVATGLNTSDGIIKLQDNIAGSGTFDDISGATLTLQAGTTQNVFRVNGFTGKYLVVNWAKGTNSAGTLTVSVYAK